MSLSPLMMIPRPLIPYYVLSTKACEFTSSTINRIVLT
jgi:hypothetical protein